MIRRLSLLMLFIALLFAPLAMIGGQASAHGSAAAPMAAHCADMAPVDQGDDSASIDCLMMCSAMLPGFAPIPTAASIAPIRPPIPAWRSLAGYGPDLELPPPRIA